MTAFEIDRAIGKLITVHMMNGGWTPQEETTFHNLCSARTRAMRPKSRRRK